MRVLLESPYAGDTARNTIYAQRALRDSIMRGEFPMAGHILYTTALNDTILTERNIGIAAHLAWLEVCDAVVVYKDYGISAGMKQAIRKARGAGKFIAYRMIGNNP